MDGDGRGVRANLSNLSRHLDDPIPRPARALRPLCLTEHDELHGDATATSQSAAVKKISVCTSHSES